MNGFPTTMTNPLSPFGSAMVERWNAAEAQPEVEVPQWTITPREEWESVDFLRDPHTNPTTRIIFHHTFPIPSTASARDVEISQMNSSFSGIAYHYLIGPEGQIYQGSRLDRIGAHTAREGFPQYNHNDGSIGIAFIGTYTHENPTPEALAAATWLVENLQYRIPTITEFFAHSDMDGHRGNGDFAENQEMLDWIKKFNKIRRPKH